MCLDSRFRTPVASLRGHAFRLTAALVSGGMVADVAADPGASTDTSPTNAPSSLGRTVVTASASPRMSSPKFVQPVLDTPQTLVVVPREVYAQQGAMNLSDVLRNTPGITFAAGEGGNVASGDSFFLRGFDASGSLFVDGVRNLGAVSRDTYNLEQVEIAKGPAGADTGRGGSSGYVNMVSKAPRREDFLDASVSYGTAEQKRFTGDLNRAVPLGSKGGWLQGTAFRLNGLFQEGGVPGRDHLRNRSWGASPSVALGLGTPTRVILQGSFGDQDNIPDSGLPVAALPGAIPTTPPTPAVDQDNWYGLAREDFEKVRQRTAQMRFEHDFPEGLTLRNQFTWNRTDRDALTTYFQNGGAAMYNPATGVVTPRRIRSQTSNSILSDQLSASAEFDTGPAEHALVAGADFSREFQEVPTWTAVNGPGTSIADPDPYRLSTAAQVPFQAANGPHSDGTLDTAAGYVFDTVKLGKRFLLNGSLRFEGYSVESETLAGSADPAARTPTALSASGTMLSWKTGLVFKPAEAGSLYVAMANSLVPPGTAFTLSSATNSLNNAALFEPVENRNYEAGVKWELFGRRLGAGLSFYRSENRNNLTQDLNTLELVQDQENIVEGVEFNVSGRVTDAWTVFGGVGYIDSRFTAPSGTSGTANNGAVLRFTPRVSANLWTTYRFPFGLTLGGGMNYSDSVLRSTSGAPVPASSTALPEAQGYWVFNTMATYEFSRNFNVRLNVYNVADEFYYRLNNNGGRYYRGTPRSFLLTANLSF